VNNVMLVLAAFFLPLFPFSMVLNIVFDHARHPVMRSIILFAWPQTGLLLLSASGTTVPGWVTAWAVLTSLMYALRTLALRELGLWTSFIGTSSWALMWALHATGANLQQLQLTAFGISVPLVLMALLVAGLEKRFSAAYLGLYGGLAVSLPRFTGILAVVVLAIIATPMFPGFFAILSMIIKILPATPWLALGIGVVWLLWSWAGARLLQGLITGSEHLAVADLTIANTWSYAIVLGALVVMGVTWLGAML